MIDLYKFVISECFMYIIKNYKFIPKNIITFTESIPFYTFRLDFVCQQKGRNQLLKEFAKIFLDLY